MMEMTNISDTSEVTLMDKTVGILGNTSWIAAGTIGTAYSSQQFMWIAGGISACLTALYMGIRCYYMVKNGGPSKKKDS